MKRIICWLHYNSSTKYGETWNGWLNESEKISCGILYVKNIFHVGVTDHTETKIVHISHKFKTFDKAEMFLANYTPILTLSTN